MKVTAINDEIADTFENQLNVLIDNKINFIELRKINNKYLYELEQEELKKIRVLLQEKNIQVSMLDTPIGKNKFNSDDELLILKKYFFLAKYFNCFSLRLFSDLSDDILKFLKEQKETDYRIYIENEKNTLFTNLDWFKKNKLLNNFNILLDIENYYYDNEEYLEDCGKYFNKIDYIHIRDYDKKNNKYTFLGKGDLKIKQLILILKKSNFGGFLSIESHLPMEYKYDKQLLFNHNLEELKESGVLK